MAKYNNSSDVPLSLAVFLASDYYDYNDDPYTISTTTLLKPLRQIVLPYRMPEENILIDLASQMANRLGAAIHDGFQRAWETNYEAAMEALGYPKGVIKRIRVNPTDAELAADKSIIPVYTEQRLSKKVGKWTVSGKFDFIAEGQVEDYKTASVWSYMNQVNSDKQVKQGSIYRWLDPKKITRDTMRIIHIFMDWRASQVSMDENYPKQRFAAQSFKLMSIEETDRFIKQKLAQIELHWDTPEPNLPPCEDEDLWRSEAVFKFYKDGNINAARSTKNFKTRSEALIFMSQKGGSGAIKEVKGEVKACKFCPSFAICTQKDQLIAAGDLVV